MASSSSADPGAEPLPECLRAELEAYNEAFMALELPWHWDAATFRSLKGSAADDCVGAYVERHQPHLLKVYDRDFLRNLILSTKARRDEAFA